VAAAVTGVIDDGANVDDDAGNFRGINQPSQRPERRWNTNLALTVRR